MPTICEVAKRAGVSTATVSRVLSRPDVVAAGTRPRVLRAVERLGYTPNAAAKHLRTLRTGKLLVTVPDISNPFFSLILRGIEDMAQREGQSVLVGDTQHDEAREEMYAQILKRKEADALIFLGHRQHPHRQRQSRGRCDDPSLFARPSAHRQCHRPIPGDLSVVGFDDIRFARYLVPPLTTVAQPMREIGEGTVRLVLQILRDGSVAPEPVTLPHILTIRSSTAPASRK